MMTSMVTIFGYGSLLSYQSVLTTMPSALNFRAASLTGYSRNFNLVSIGGIRSGSADFKTGEVAAATIRKEENKDDCIVRGCIFEIPVTELAPYLEREHRYIPLQVFVTDEESTTPVLSWTVIENTDDAYRASMSSEEYTTRIGQYYDDNLWGKRNILPMRNYLNSCIRSSFLLGGKVWLQSMLDSYLADGSTVGQYVRTYPERFVELKDIL